MDTKLKSLTIRPPDHPLVGRVTPPGSKSITYRALLLAGLAEGRSRISGALMSWDTALMAAALQQMGVVIDELSETEFIVEGSGRLTAPAAPLMLGNAGTATRFLTAAAALCEGRVVIDGDEHMRRRPIRPLVDALRSLGVDASTATGCPPVVINGTGRFGHGLVEIDSGLSSQYVSALLMAAPFGDGPVEVRLTGEEIGAKGYVELTLAAMRAFGAVVERTDERTWQVEPVRYGATDFRVEPDASAATYIWAAETLTGGAVDLGLPPDAFTQPDANALEVIRKFPNLPAVIDGSQMQDAVPTLAVLAVFNKSPVRFTGIANLRVKECDRVSAMATELSRVKPGLAREEGDDLVVESDPDLIGQMIPTSVETYSDHRIAMSMALMGLMVQGITILDPDCVGKTYPGYWDMLRSLGVEFELSGD
jgi:3-phosphoshikimate 1-carboxyvinyltransferase